MSFLGSKRAVLTLLDCYEPEATDFTKDVLVKKGVDITRLKPSIKRCLKAALQAHKEIGRNLVVTSTYDGRHMKTSKHYSHQAFDSRIWLLSDREKQRILDRVYYLIGSEDFFILIEPTHIHWQLKSEGLEKPSLDK